MVLHGVAASVLSANHGVAVGVLVDDICHWKCYFQLLCFLLLEIHVSKLHKFWLKRFRA